MRKSELPPFLRFAEETPSPTLRAHLMTQPVAHAKSTKIVATLGPTSSSEDVLKTLIHEGLNVARINFSHGSHDVHGVTIDTVRRLDEELGTYTSMLADLQGPKLRVGDIEGGEIQISTAVCTAGSRPD